MSYKILRCFFLCRCQPVKSKKPHTVVLHSVPHACNPSPKSIYFKWYPTTLQWQSKAARKRGKILCLADSCFSCRLSLSLLLNTSSSTIISCSGCLSGSIRNRGKLSGHLPLPPKHEGERFSDHSEKNNWPSLLLCSSHSRAVYPGSCAQGPRGLTLCLLRPTVVQRQGKRMTSVLCGTEMAQWSCQQHQRDH